LARDTVRKKLKVAGSGVAGSRPSPVSARETPTAESASSADSSSESGSEDDSTYESASEEEPQNEEPSPIPLIRPNDPDKAIEFDIIKAVWAKRSVVLSGAVIRSALGEYWEIIRNIREQWKSETQKLQQATEKKEAARVSDYRSRADEKRRLLESCLRLTLRHGHRDIVERYVKIPFASSEIFPLFHKRHS